VYTDKKGSYVLFGATAVDTATKANLTAERMDKLGEFEFGKLPLGDAVKIVHGKGTRKLVTFEDPNCGFCKKLSHELAKIDDVTIFTILYPILSPDSTEKSKAIWCSTDREKTYTEYMMRGTTLPDVKACDSPISRNVTLGQKLRVMGTPAILFEDNTRSPGYMAAEEIETRLDKAAKKK
jgi:thiol:disulfide interchange protein DsbC